MGSATTIGNRILQVLERELADAAVAGVVTLGDGSEAVFGLVDERVTLYVWTPDNGLERTHLGRLVDASLIERSTIVDVGELPAVELRLVHSAFPGGWADFQLGIFGDGPRREVRDALLRILKTD
jgi:hypothetical protein